MAIRTDLELAEKQIIFLQVVLERLLDMKIVIEDSKTGEQIPTTAKELVEILVKAQQWIVELEDLCQDAITKVEEHSYGHSGALQLVFDNIKAKYEK